MNIYRFHTAYVAAFLGFVVVFVLSHIWERRK